MYIPTFYFNGKGKYLMEGRKKILDHHFKKTSFQCFKEHIQELNDDDLYRQELLIRMALGERDINLFQKKDFLQIRQAEELIPYIQPWIIEHDESIFCSTIEAADYGCSLKRLDRNLYNGIPGLLLALALLSKSNPEITKVYHILERNMFRYTDEMSMDASKKKPKNTGMFVGEGSIVYTYLLLYKILGHIEFLEYAKKHAEIVQSQIACDEAYDLLSGNAGWIVVLSKLFEVTGDSKYIEYAIDIVEKGGVEVHSEEYKVFNMKDYLTITSSNPEEPYSGKVYWESSNPESLSVDQDGTMKLIDGGRATITASIDGMTDSLTFDVIDFDIYADGDETPITGSKHAIPNYTDPGFNIQTGNNYLPSSNLSFTTKWCFDRNPEKTAIGTLAGTKYIISGNGFTGSIEKDLRAEKPIVSVLIYNNSDNSTPIVTVWFDTNS